MIDEDRLLGKTKVLLITFQRDLVAFLREKFEAMEKGDWWDEYVVDAFSHEVKKEKVRNKADDLDDLDVYDLLKVLDHNWEGSLGISVSRRLSSGRRDAVKVAMELRHHDSHLSKVSSKDWTSVYMYLEGVEYLAKTLSLSKAVLHGVASIRAEIYKLVPPETGQAPDVGEPSVTLQKVNLSQYILEASTPAKTISEFVGCKKHLEQLTLWALNKKHDGMLVFGPPGSGKTSISGEFIKRIRNQAESSLHIASHFIRSRDIMSHDLSRMEFSLAAQIGNAMGWSHPSHNVSDEAICRALLASIKELVCVDPGRIIFVIDGVDELPVKLQDRATMYIEQWQSQGIRCLVLSRRIEAFKNDNPHIEFAYNDEDNLTDLRDAATKRITAAAKSKSSPEKLLEMILMRAQGQWVYLDIMLRGIENGTLDDAAILKLPQGMKNYYAVTLEKLREELDGGGVYLDYVVPCLALLALTPLKLSAREIAEIGSVEPRYVADVISKVGELLVSSKAPSTGSHEKNQTEEVKYELCHQSVREFLSIDTRIGAELANQGRNLIRAHCNGRQQIDLSREQVTELLERFGDAEMHLTLYGSTPYLIDVPGSGLDGARETLDLVPQRVLATEAPNSSSFLLAVKSAVASKEVLRLTDTAQSKLGLLKLALDKPELAKSILDRIQPTHLEYAELVGACTLRGDSESYHLAGYEDDKRRGHLNPKYSLAKRLALLGGTGFLWSESEDQFEPRVKKTLYLEFEGWSRYKDHVKRFELGLADYDGYHRHWEIGIRYGSAIHLLRLRLTLTGDLSSLLSSLEYQVRVIATTSWLAETYGAISALQRLVSDAYTIISRSAEERHSIDSALERLACKSIARNDFKSFILVLDLMRAVGSEAGAQLIVNNQNWVIGRLNKIVDLFARRFYPEFEKEFNRREEYEREYGDSDDEDWDVMIQEMAEYLPIDADVSGSVFTILDCLNSQSEESIIDSRSRIVSAIRPRMESSMFRSLKCLWDFEAMFKPKASKLKRIGEVDLQNGRKYVSKIHSDLMEIVLKIQAEYDGPTLKHSQNIMTFLTCCERSTREKPGRVPWKLKNMADGLIRSLEEFVKKDCPYVDLTIFMIESYPSIVKLDLLCERLCYCVDFEEKLSQIQQILTSIAHVGLYGKCEGRFNNVGKEWFSTFFGSFKSWDGQGLWHNEYPYEHDTLDLLLLKVARLDPNFICGLIELLERERNDESGNQNAWPDFIVYLRAALYRTILCLPKPQMECALERISKLPGGQEVTHTVFDDSSDYLQRFFQLSTSDLHKALEDAYRSGDIGLQYMLDSSCAEIKEFVPRNMTIRNLEDVLNVLEN